MKKKYILIVILFASIVGFGNNTNKAFADEGRKNSLIISKGPKYIVMNPNEKTPTFLDDQGKIPEISGSWESKSPNNLQVLQVGVGDRNVTMTNPWYWCNIQAPDVLKNTAVINKFENISLLSGLEGKEGAGGTYKLLTNLPANTTYGVFFGMESQDKWIYATLSTPIPFYIKAPKVNVKTDTESLQAMIANQVITGTGQVDDTVTIKDGDKTWTGTVGSNGQFSIETKGVTLGDTITITQINKTGDKSVSDPVNVEIITPNNGCTPITFKINSMYLPSNPNGSKKGPSGTKPHVIPDETDFGLLFTPEKFDFGKLSNFSQGNTIKNTLDSNKVIGVGDVRSDNPGWQLTAKATTLKNNSDNNILDGDITMNTAVKHVSYDGKTYSIDASIPDYASGQTPSTTGSVDLKLGGDATTIMNAVKGKGTGLWATDMSNVIISSTNTNNITSGTYEGTITWNLSNTPGV